MIIHFLTSYETDDPHAYHRKHCLYSERILKNIVKFLKKKKKGAQYFVHSLCISDQPINIYIYSSYIYIYICEESGTLFTSAQNDNHSIRILGKGTEHGFSTFLLLLP